MLAVFSSTGAGAAVVEGFGGALWQAASSASAPMPRPTALANRFDLLLTDIQMPVMDGIALALAAARDFPKLTILLMTGFADQRERASGLNAIAHDVVTKPFSIADIRTAVADALAAGKKR